MVRVAAVVVVASATKDESGSMCRLIPSTDAVTMARDVELAIPATSAMLVGGKQADDSSEESPGR